MGLAVTYAPYEEEQFWLEAQAQAFTNAGERPVVAWYNLQNYAGGAGNVPSQWVQAIRDFGPDKLGVTDPPAFIVPGFQCCQAGGCPEDIQNTFAQLTQADPGINGGFIWQLGDIEKSAGQPCAGSSKDTNTITAANYAAAILQGLEGKPSTGA
jgi:hypothetical protein